MKNTLKIPKKILEIITTNSDKKFICCIEYSSNSKEQHAIHTIFKPELLLPSQVITPAIYLCSKHCTLYIKTTINHQLFKKKYQKVFTAITTTATALNVVVTIKIV